MAGEIGAAAIGGAAGLAGIGMGLRGAQKAADKSWKRSVWFEQNRYPIMVESLKQAGLNPILAVKGMSGGTPASPVARTESYGAAANSAASLMLAKAQADKLRAETKKIESQEGPRAPVREAVEEMVEELLDGIRGSQIKPREALGLPSKKEIPDKVKRMVLSAFKLHKPKRDANQRARRKREFEKAKSPW